MSTYQEIECLPCVEVNPSNTPKKSMIWLHGLGADGNDFVPMISQLGLPQELGFRYVFPHAPVMPITINQGVHMRAWFDIYGMDIDSKLDEANIEKSMLAVQRLIYREIEQGILAENIVLGGFSQGAVMALIAGLRLEQLPGIVALSGFLPRQTEQLAKLKHNHKPRIFLAHGCDDNVVPYALGKATYMALQAEHYPVTWHSYPMGHCVCPQELADLKDWLQQLEMR